MEYFGHYFKGFMSSAKAGFTLIEILVVLFIVSIMTGLLLVRIVPASPTERLDEEAARLLAILQLAADEAVLGGRELGFEPGPEGYRFLEFEPVRRHWAQVKAAPLQQRTLEAGLTLHLQVEDRSALRLQGGETPAAQGEQDGKAAEDAQGGQDAAEPPILLLSSGEVTPFDLELRAEGDSRRLSTDGFSGFKLQSSDR